MHMIGLPTIILRQGEAGFWRRKRFRNYAGTILISDLSHRNFRHSMSLPTVPLFSLFIVNQLSIMLGATTLSQEYHVSK